MRNYVVCLALLLSSCGEGTAPRAGAPAPGPGAQEGAPAYAVVTNVFTNDPRLNYFSVVPSLGEETRVDLASALEVPGLARLYAPAGGGFFTVGSSDDLSITRYDVAADGSFRAGGRLSMAALGVTSLLNRMVFLSRAKAYYLDNSQGQVVVWNPETMEIVKTIDLSAVVRPGYAPQMTVFNYVVRDGRLLVPVGWYDFDGRPTLKGTGLAVVDTDADALLSFAVDDRCDAAIELVTTASGDAYYGNGYRALAWDDAVRGASRPGCVLRVRADAEAFDPDYLVRSEELTGGKLALNIYPSHEDGIAYVSVLDETLLAWAKETDPARLQSDPAWRRWRFDLAARTAAPVPDAPATPPEVNWFSVDGKTYLLTATADYATSTLVELTAAGEVPRLSNAGGYMAGVARIR